jgi:hypothetical protein
MTASAGQTLLIAERDYMYGVGDLRLRVETVDRTHPVAYDGEPWYRVIGIEVRRDGLELGRRDVLVRGRTLRPS